MFQSKLVSARAKDTNDGWALSSNGRSRRTGAGVISPYTAGLVAGNAVVKNDSAPSVVKRVICCFYSLPMDRRADICQLTACDWFRDSKVKQTIY